MKDYKKYLPDGCSKFADHGCITKTDIKNNRPYDQCRISTEFVIGHGFIIMPVFHLFKKNTWKICSTTTYEMSGNYNNGYMGGRCWAETDLTGLEWHFNNEKDAETFKSLLNNELNNA